MSTQRSSRPDAGEHLEHPVADQRTVRRARRNAERRRRLMRLDLALGVAFGLLLILITPGLAIAGLYALLAIVLCVASLAAGWFVRRRRRRPVRRALRTAGGDGDRSFRRGHPGDGAEDDQPITW